MKKFLMWALIICGLFYLCSPSDDESSNSGSSSSSSSSISFAGTYTVPGNVMKYNSLYQIKDQGKEVNLDFSILEDGRVLLFGSDDTTGQGSLCGKVTETSNSAILVEIERDINYWVRGSGYWSPIKKYDQYVFDRAENLLYVELKEYNNRDIKRPLSTPVPFSYNSTIRKNPM